MLAFEIFIPLVLFFILLGLRQKKPAIPVKEGRKEERLEGYRPISREGQGGYINRSEKSKRDRLREKKKEREGNCLHFGREPKTVTSDSRSPPRGARWLHLKLT